MDPTKDAFVDRGKAFIEVAGDSDGWNMAVSLLMEIEVVGSDGRPLDSSSWLPFLDAGIRWVLSI